MLICPSILAADFAKLGDDVRAVAAAGADMIHVDVMDGHYVPEITIGPQMVRALRPHTTLPLDVHLMIEPVDPHIEKFASAGANIISFHPEASKHPHRTASAIRAAGCKAGIVLNPATPIAWLDGLMDVTDLILVMSINPGYGGQQFLPSVLPKIAQLRDRIAASGRDIILQVDGGVNPDNAKTCKEAGANALVVGTAIFSKPQGDWAETIATLRT